MVPQHVRLFLDLDAPDHPVLRQQHVADLTQEVSCLRARPSAALQFRGERLDAIEDAGDLGLVVGQHQAFGQHIGDDLQALGRGVLERDGAGRFDLILALRLDDDLHRIAFRHRQGVADPWAQRAYHLVLFDGRQADEHRDTVTEQDRDAIFA